MQRLFLHINRIWAKEMLRGRTKGNKAPEGITEAKEPTETLTFLDYLKRYNRDKQSVNETNSLRIR